MLRDRNETWKLTDDPRHVGGRKGQDLCCLGLRISVYKVKGLGAVEP